MRLLSVLEIQEGLDREFLHLEPMLTGLRLVNGGASDAAVKACERQIGANFPCSFRDLIRAFDFGRLTIGPVVFCNAGNYLFEIDQLNFGINWWGEGQRPSNLVMIANSDPYAILLAIDSGQVLAMDAELGWRNAVDVAREFELYLRAIGTAMLCRKDETDRQTLAEDIAAAVGAKDVSYWRQLVA